MGTSTTEIARLVDSIAPQYQVDPELMKKLVFRGENQNVKEGGTVPTDAVSPKGATGVAQVMPAVFNSLKAQGKLPADADPTDPKTNLTAGIIVAQEAAKRYPGNPKAQAAYYNGGRAQGDAVAAGKEPPSTETKNYLARVFMDTPNDASLSTGIPVTPTASTPGTGAATTPALKETYKETSRQLTYTPDLQRYLATQTALTKQLQEAMGMTAQTTENEAQSAMQLGDVKAEQARQATAVALAKDNQQQQILDIAHASIADPQSIFVDANKRRQDAQVTMDALRPKILEEANVKPWDDPLRWLVNQFTMPALVQTYNAAHAADAEAVKRVLNTREMVKAQMEIDPAPIQDRIRAQGILAAQAAQLEALANADKVRTAGSHVMAQQVMSLISQTNATFDAALGYARLTSSNVAITEQDAAAAKLRPTLELMNLKRKAAGLPEISFEELKLMSPEARTANLELGQIPGQVFGTDPGKAYKNLTHIGALSGLSQTNPVVNQFLGNIKNSQAYKVELANVKSSQEGQRLSQLDQEAQALTNLANSQWTAASKEPKPGTVVSNNFDIKDKDSPYVLKLLNTTQIKELGDNMFVRQLNDSKVNDRRHVVTNEEVLGWAVAKGESDPKLVPKIAKELSDFYRIGIIQQWEQGGARAVGYPKPQSYSLSHIMTAGTTDRAIQMFSPSEVEHWIIANMKAREKQRNISEMMFSEPPISAGTMIGVPTPNSANARGYGSAEGTNARGYSGVPQ